MNAWKRVSSYTENVPNGIEQDLSLQLQEYVPNAAHL